MPLPHPKASGPPFLLARQARDFPTAARIQIDTRLHDRGRSLSAEYRPPATDAGAGCVAVENLPFSFLIGSPSLPRGFDVPITPTSARRIVLPLERSQADLLVGHRSLQVTNVSALGPRTPDRYHSRIPPGQTDVVAAESESVEARCCVTSGSTVRPRLHALELAISAGRRLVSRTGAWPSCSRPRDQPYAAADVSHYALGCSASHDVLGGAVFPLALSCHAVAVVADSGATSCIVSASSRPFCCNCR